MKKITTINHLLALEAEETIKAKRHARVSHHNKKQGLKQRLADERLKEFSFAA